MPLNEDYEWNDVQYQINSQASYDVDLSFNGLPKRQILRPLTELYRLDFPVVLGIFMKVWWMKKGAFDRVFKRGGSSPSALRREWENRLALSEPGRGGKGKFGGWLGEAAPRTQVVTIVITQPVYAWVGTASPLNDRVGGEEQVYLPNLAHRAGPYRSEHARLLWTYTLPVD